MSHAHGQSHVSRTDDRLLNDTALLLIRLMIGVVFVFHGSQKVFGLFGGHGVEGFAAYLSSLNIPFPLLNAWAAGLVELLGGLALLLGTGVRIAAIPLSITMLVAAFLANGHAFDMQQGGMEYPLTLAVIVVALGLTGPGRFNTLNLYRVASRNNSSVNAASVPTG